jgi:asparagine synthase (glutamine-hydrolysing)
MFQQGGRNICGICGTTSARDSRAVDAMNARMVYRGPDDAGIFVEPGGGIALGVRRLSVIDPTHGHQPLANEDETVWAVLNGEIYNFPLLRERLQAAGHRFASRVDTEVLVHLYEDRGPDLVHELEGMYAFAIWDSRGRQLLLARDRFGEKPLFYTDRSGTLIFASELTALLAAVEAPHELDPRVLDEYFTYGYVPGGRCLIRGITQLEPGHLLLWDADKRTSEVRPYWRPPSFQPGPQRPLDDLVEEAAALLDQSVASRLIADVPVGVFLSGGLDSTLVAALAAQHIGGCLKTFTVDYDVGSVGERGGARVAAAAIGADHHELILTADAVRASVPAMLAELDQPLADPAFIALRALAEFARREVTVAVGGEGADELFGGYPRYRWLARAASLPGWVPRRLPALAAARVGRVSGLERLARFSDILAPGSIFDRHVGWVTSHRQNLRERLYGPRLREVLERRELLAPHPDVDFHNGDVLGSLMRLDQVDWLPDDVLAKADRATMRASLEMRTPYLSRDLAEFAATVPPSVHVQGGGKLLLRQVLRKAMPAFRLQPAKIAFRTPCAAWLRGPLAPALKAQLSESALYRDGWFDRRAVSSLVGSHCAGHTDMSHALWPIFVLACWYDANMPVPMDEFPDLSPASDSAHADVKLDVSSKRGSAHLRASQRRIGN